MNLRLQKLSIFITLLLSSLSMVATHYINHTGKTIIITNVTGQKRSKKKYSTKNSMQSEVAAIIYSLEIENDQEGDLDNDQGDEITITSPGMSDKRKLFPTNNSFNYVITLNKYNPKFEKFDINHAADEEEMKPGQGTKAKKAKHKKS
ncbi:MAG: hypothetical protein Q8Q60_02045 [Candidatus Chromulinivorax sp.]|nr:hypothetical protein [Candidatus Chromulinivorax sp.]